MQTHVAVRARVARFAGAVKLARSMDRHAA